MAEKIGPKIQIEGEAEFKKAIADINRNIKTMGTEMKAVTSAYDRNDQSSAKLIAQNQVLNKQIDAQRSKLNELKAMLDKAKDAYGENDAQTQKLQQQMNLATAALNKSELQFKNNTTAIQETNQATSRWAEDLRLFEESIKGTEKKLQLLASELDVVTSAYSKNDSSVAALEAKGKIYNKMVEAQRDKLTELKNSLVATKEEYGGNSQEAHEMQLKINKATAELNRMERQLDGNSQELEEAAKAGDKAGDSLDDAGDAAEKSGAKFEKLGGIMKVSAVAIGAVAVAAGAAAAKLGKEVVSAFAEYEQLVGGVDTLFKSSSQELQNYAANAYKTAGLSANDYMETVTSFSASLLQSLGGDTEKAVSYADMAITDMSDNANKMGTDMASIQNAYQGFAKQNYTMLDNLKLGYGGTKSEMERLLKDAGKIAGVKFDISSYADVVEAIHVMQENMGIAGTTALEAEETISGSVNAMSSAFQNLLVGFGNADADISALMGNLIDAFKTVLINVTPVIANIAASLPEAFGAMGDALGDLLPELLGTVTDLFKQILDTLLKLLPELMPVAVDAILTIVDTLIDNLPMIIDAAFELITALAEGILEALPELVPKIVEVVVKIVQTIVENLPLILGAALQIIVALAAGLIKSIPELVKSVPELVKSIVTAFSDGKKTIVEIGKNVVRGIWEGITGMAKWLANKVKGFVDGIVSAFTGKDGIDAHSPSRLFATFGSYMAQGIGEGFTAEMQNVARQINSSVPTVSMTGQYQATARMGEGIVNGLAGIIPKSGPVTIQVVLPNGKELAQVVFDPLTGIAKQRGVAFG